MTNNWYLLSKQTNSFSVLSLPRVLAGGHGRRDVWDLAPAACRRGTGKPWCEPRGVCSPSLSKGTVRNHEGRQDRVNPEFTSPLQPPFFCPGCVCTSVSYIFPHWSTEKQEGAISLSLNILRIHGDGGIWPGSASPACQASLGDSSSFFHATAQPSGQERGLGVRAETTCKFSVP